MTEFGCTVCHDGQGSATDFRWASHTPNDPTQRQRWHDDFGWSANPHWGFPMLARRFHQSHCLRCHQNVTELEPSRRFSDPPAAKSDTPAAKSGAPAAGSPPGSTPRPARPRAAAFGFVEFDGQADDTTVLVNGKPMSAGQTPGKLQLPAGNYEIRMVRGGAIIDRQKVEVRPSSTTRIVVKR